MQEVMFLVAKSSASEAVLARIPRSQAVERSQLIFDDFLKGWTLLGHSLPSRFGFVLGNGDGVGGEFSRE